MEQSFTLRMLARWIKASARLAGVLTLMGALCGLLYALAAPKTYNSTSSLVLGTYALPASMAMEGGMSNSGPLGLEVPPETVVTLVASPIVSSIAVKADPAIGTDTEVSEATSVSAPTTNSLDITAAGSSAAQAQARASEMAEAVITYRKQQVDARLTSMRDGAQGAIDKRSARMAAINKSLTTAKGATQQGLLSELDELAKSNATDQSAVSDVDALIQSFDGGAVISRSATTATRSPSIPLAIAMGAVSGLAAALLGRLLWGILTGRVSVGNGRIKFGVPVLAAEGEWTGHEDIAPRLLGPTLSRLRSGPIGALSLDNSELGAAGIELLNHRSAEVIHCVNLGSLQGDSALDLDAYPHVILVADQHSTSAGQVRNVVSTISDAGASVVGIVLPSPKSGRGNWMRSRGSKGQKLLEENSRGTGSEGTPLDSEAASPRRTMS